MRLYKSNCRSSGAEISVTHIHGGCPFREGTGPLCIASRCYCDLPRPRFVYFGNLRESGPSRYPTGDMARYKGQRKSHRRWIAAPVLICSRGAHIEGHSINISDGGIYLFAAANLSLGEQIEIEFCPPDSGSVIRTWGTVRRRALYLYAIEFVSEDAASARDRTSARTHPVQPIPEAGA